MKRFFCLILVNVLAASIPFALVGCASTKFVEETSPSSYPAPAIPAPEAAAIAPKLYQPSPMGGGSMRPGDKLELFVEEDDAFNGIYLVREQGDIIIPSVGRIQVAGLSIGNASARVKMELELRYLKKATVILDRVSRAPVLEYSAPAPFAAPQAAPKLTIYIQGKVNRPGQHQFDLPSSGHLGVYEAILIVGGLSNFADPAKVHLLRNDHEGRRRKIPVNISKIEKGLEKDPSIGNGDIVVVPEKVFGF